NPMTTSISRRELLLGAAGAAAAPTPPARRPNIPWLVGAEIPSHAMHRAGKPVGTPPHPHPLARERSRLSPPHNASPVLSPSRASAFSGRYAHVHGVTTNQVPAHNGEIFLPSILKHYGYHTAISGKLHFVPRRFDFGFDEFYSFSAEGPTPEKGYQAFLQKK